MWLLFSFLFLSAVRGRHLYVHLAPHSHEDLGWLKTVDEYFYGANQTIYEAGVQYILDTVIRELALDPAKRFTYVESGFFYRWWREQTPIVQSAVKRLVAGHQLQFANGGWVMHDEAVTTFEDQLDQMAFGHQFLLETFGIKPTIGWQIDPFGHSEANADLYAKMGLNGLFFARIDYQDKAERLNQSALEMIWRPNTNTGFPGEIFTHVLFAHYSFPAGFCWDIRCQNDPVMDDPTLENYNAQAIASGFAQWVWGMAESYRTEHLFVCMGDDFTYQNAAMVYKNIDKLIALVNSNSTYDMTLLYSTPMEYLEAVHSLNASWPLKTDDFFPYADSPHAYWTGYFTSRATFKGMVRTFGSRMRAALDLLSVSFLRNLYSPGDFPALRNAIAKLQAPMSVAQHHDAVTGTEKQHVTFDYERMLAAGALSSDAVLNSMLNSQAETATGRSPLRFSQCLLANETVCDLTRDYNFSANSSLLLAVLNPTYHSISHLVRIPVPSSNISLYDQSGSIADYDIIENYFTPKISGNNFTVYLRISAGAMQTVYFSIVAGSVKSPLRLAECEQNCELENEQYKLLFVGDYLGSSLWEFERSPSIMTVLNLTLAYYAGSKGDPNSSQASGAYIFRPNSLLTPIPKKYADFRSLWLAKGEVVDIAAVSYGTSGFQLLILPKNCTDPSVQVETWLNSISLSQYTGREIVILYTTSLYNNQTFYTDSNGMGMVQRVWDYRPTWELNSTNEPQSCNYYPVTSAIYFSDLYSGNRFTVVTDRAEGGTTANYAATSTVELMIHRRLLADDGRGVGEALNEPDPYNHAIGLRVILSHKLLLANSDSEQRVAEETNLHPPQFFLSHLSGSDPVIADSSPLWRELPIDFQANFRAASPNAFIVRLRNTLDSPQSLNFSDFLSLLPSANLTESALTENQPMSDVFANHFSWNIDGEPAASRQTEGEVLAKATIPSEEPILLHFNPGQIRSFFLETKENSQVALS